VFPGLFDDILGLHLFGYITFRVAMAALTAFGIALFAGGPAIAWLKRQRAAEDPAKFDAQQDLKQLVEAGPKKDTPTLGGAFLIASLLISVLLWARLDNLHVVLAVMLTAGFAAVGFVDDYLKLTAPKTKGLTPTAKMIGLSAVCLGALGLLTFYAWWFGRPTLLTLFPPFFKEARIELFQYGLIGVAVFVAFQWLVIVGSANAANITDGLDGLAAGCMLIAGFALSIFCYVSGRPDWTGYLDLPYVRQASEMAVVGGAMCGACMGFLWFNAYPAKVFMGDSGSLPLGGLLGWMAVVSKQELVLPLIALVFVAELGSSWLQKLYFQRTGGKRLFTCAPIHHGLQLYGGVFTKTDARWHEVTVVVRFWIIAAACAMLSLALLKVR